jgi:hypothetical protein
MQLDRDNLQTLGRSTDPHLGNTAVSQDQRYSVNLRRMVVLIVDTNDYQVSCSVSNIDDEMWRNVYSSKCYASSLHVASERII